MNPGLHSVAAPDEGVFRIGRRPDPFKPPGWELALEDGTFGNRFDDPRGRTGLKTDQRFRMIYCAGARAASFAETMAPFRPSLALLSELGNVRDRQGVRSSLGLDARDQPVLPVDWRERRAIGHAHLASTLQFVDISHPGTIQHLRTELSRCW